MKKLNRTAFALVAISALAIGTFGLVSCSEEQPSEVQPQETHAASLTGSHTGYVSTVTATVSQNGESASALLSGNDQIVNVKLYDDNSYELHIVYQTFYNQPMMTIDATFYGTNYTLAAEADGYCELSLTAASVERTIISLNIMNGMFIKYWDTETTTFPTTMVGDDTTQLSKEQLLEAFNDESYAYLTGDHTYYIAVEADGSLSTGLSFSKE
jgi:hypothetical protein